MLGKCCTPELYLQAFPKVFSVVIDIKKITVKTKYFSLLNPYPHITDASNTFYGYISGCAKTEPVRMKKHTALSSSVIVISSICTFKALEIKAPSASIFRVNIGGSQPWCLFPGCKKMSLVNR